jgi:hypothetical protein
LNEIVHRFDVLVFEALYRDVEVYGPCAVNYCCETVLQFGEVGLAEAEIWTTEITWKSENFALLFFV